MDRDKASYEHLHDHAELNDNLAHCHQLSGCIIDHYGDHLDGAFQDIAVPYYHAECIDE